MADEPSHAPAPRAPALGASPSARRLLSRMQVPDAGATPESALESMPAEPDVAPVTVPDPRQRLDAANATLRRLVAGARDVDETDIDRLIRDAEKALQKLNGEGEDADLSAGEAFGLEAVIEADGSRPVLFVQGGTIDLGAPELNEPLAAGWRRAAENALPGIVTAAAAVGAVQLPAFDNMRIGTAFAVAPGLVMTNRHVLEEIARWTGTTWEWTRDAVVEFGGERESKLSNAFPVDSVVMTGPDAINRRVNFAHLDLAILKVGGDLAAFPAPLRLAQDPLRTKVTSGQQPQVYVMGFPAKPLVQPAGAVAAADARPAPGHEYEEILEKLYQNRFGSKRWAPGFAEAGPGQLAGDGRQWVMSHDASTLAGNSGSCVIDLSRPRPEVVGLHFGGRSRVENYAHVLGALHNLLETDAGLRGRLGWV